MDCIFCKIINGDIPSQRVYEDEHVIAFKDINPAAPAHILIVPKIHIESIMELDADNSDLIGHVFLAAKKIALENGLSDSGFRVVANCGREGGQTVEHIHFHILGGRSMQWPPG